MEQVLLVVQVLLAIGLIGMVLIQRSDSDGFGLSGGGGNLMSGRTAANTMTRITAILATLFIVNSLALSVLATSGRAPSIIESLEEQSIFHRTRIRKTERVAHHRPHARTTRQRRDALLPPPVHKVPHDQEVCRDALVRKNL